MFVLITRFGAVVRASPLVLLIWVSNNVGHIQDDHLEQLHSIFLTSKISYAYPRVNFHTDKIKYIF